MFTLFMNPVNPGKCAWVYIQTECNNDQTQSTEEFIHDFNYDYRVIELHEFIHDWNYNY